jgi:hypothetical protein
VQDYVFPSGRRAIAVVSGVLTLAVMGMGSQARAASYGTPSLSLL